MKEGTIRTLQSPISSLPPVWAVVLAAGASRRMGRPKLLLPLGDRTVLERVLDNLLASSLAGVVVVLGHHAGAIQAGTRRLDDPRVRVAINPDPTGEMFSSVQVGVAALPASAVAFLQVLGDQPFIPPALIERLIAEIRTGSPLAVIPEFAGRRGHPIAVSLRLREAILAAPATATLRDLLAPHRAEIRLLPVETPAILDDLDDEAAYRQALDKVTSHRV